MLKMPGTPSCSRSHSWPSRFPHWGLGHRTWALLCVGSALGNPIGCLHLVEQDISTTSPPLQEELPSELKSSTPPP